MRWLLITALAPLLVLAGCAGIAPAPTAERVHAGRFAVTVRAPDKTENISGRFTLAIGADTTRVDLATPLGNTLARIESDPSGTTLYAPADDGSLRTTRGPNAEVLTEQLLGWTLPLSGIGDWILGRAVPGRPATVSEAQGRRQLEQDGWIIRVLERFDTPKEGTRTGTSEIAQGGIKSGEKDGAAGEAAPRRLSFERPAGARGAPAIMLRLVLDEPVR